MALKLLIPAFITASAAMAPGRVAAGADFVAGHTDDVALSDAPINPDWIVSGSPQARAGRHSVSADGLATTQVWHCTAGSFHWTFFEEETVYILDGSVRVTTAEGDVRLLEPGDVAYFAPRTTALWEIDDHVRKIAFCRTTGNPAVNALRTMLGRMKRAMIG